MPAHCAKGLRLKRDRCDAWSCTASVRHRKPFAGLTLPQGRPSQQEGSTKVNSSSDLTWHNYEANYPGLPDLHEAMHPARRAKLGQLWSNQS